MRTIIAEKAIHEIDDILRLLFLELVFKADVPSAIKAQDITDTLARTIKAKFKVRSNAAINKGVSIIESHSRGRISDKEWTSVIQAFDLEIQSGFSEDVAPYIRKAIGLSYASGQLSAAAPETKASFNLTDVRTQEFIAANNAYWIGEHYNDTLRGAVSNVVFQGLDRGMGRKEMAGFMRDTLGSQFEKSDAYWTVMASAAVQTSRNMGKISTFEIAEIYSVEFFNPNDERTSEICKYLDGTVWETKLIVGIRNKYIAATNPEQVKDAIPWISADDMKSIGGGDTSPANPEKLAEKGIAVPPLHGDCRSSLVASQISSEERLIEEIAVPGEQAPTANKESASPKVKKEVIENKRGETVPLDLDKRDINHTNYLVLHKDQFLHSESNMDLKSIIAPKNVNVSEDDIKRIKKDGIPPIIVERKGEGYVIVDGRSRYAAAQEAGFEKIPVVERGFLGKVDIPKDATPEKRWLLLRENRERWQVSSKYAFGVSDPNGVAAGDELDKYYIAALQHKTRKDAPLSPSTQRIVDQWPAYRKAYNDEEIAWAKYVAAQPGAERQARIKREVIKSLIRNEPGSIQRDPESIAAQYDGIPARLLYRFKNGQHHIVQGQRSKDWGGDYSFQERRVKFFNGNANQGHTVTHEFGHVVDGMLTTPTGVGTNNTAMEWRFENGLVSKKTTESFMKTFYDTFDKHATGALEKVYTSETTKLPIGNDFSDYYERVTGNYQRSYQGRIYRHDLFEISGQDKYKYGAKGDHKTFGKNDRPLQLWADSFAAVTQVHGHGSSSELWAMTKVYGPEYMKEVEKLVNEMRVSGEYYNPVRWEKVPK
jgi:hypothetical protein